MHKPASVCPSLCGSRGESLGLPTTGCTFGSDVHVYHAPQIWPDPISETRVTNHA